MREGITIKILPNGNLALLAGNETRRYIKEHEDKDAYALLWDLTEHYWTNGRYEPFNAEDANPFVGLSSAPCIAEEMDIHDDGSKEIVGRYWYFPNYMIENPLETLKNTGRVVFTLAA